MNPRLTSHHLESMAWTIDRDGIDAIPVAALRELGFEARNAGARSELVDLLADRGTPAVVRQRAFGHLAALVGRSARRTDDVLTVTDDRVICAA